MDLAVVVVVCSNLARGVFSSLGASFGSCSLKLDSDTAPLHTATRHVKCYHKLKKVENGHVFKRQIP